jgi:phytoene desaturase
MLIFINMLKIFMMNHNGQRTLFMLISFGNRQNCCPEGMESFFLVPLAPGINDTEALREEYFDKIMDRFETLTKQSVKIILYLSNHSVKMICNGVPYKGNAYEWQIHYCKRHFETKIKSKKVKNLYFTGQLTWDQSSASY